VDRAGVELAFQGKPAVVVFLGSSLLPALHQVMTVSREKRKKKNG
jgi:hypothetical protein